MPDFQGTAPHSSPHARRYFLLSEYAGRTGDLFSARAEVFPRLATVSREAPSLLRTRGGISIFDRSGH
ncbi:hypothetical protein SAMN05421878_10210 [Actinobaculum suis]|uniref:Uncharacterized protein n=1 Tax=Actinobaculum suis TaxID=1657 RepID=A0A1G6ZZR5_9ACTO|nr:hypothetical protein SAMN05421878_10210 [Actinobaculum suis]